MEDKRRTLLQMKCLHPSENHIHNLSLVIDKTRPIPVPLYGTQNKAIMGYGVHIGERNLTTAEGIICRHFEHGDMAHIKMYTFDYETKHSLFGTMTYEQSIQFRKSLTNASNPLDHAAVSAVTFAHEFIQRIASPEEKFTPLEWLRRSYYRRRNNIPVDELPQLLQPFETIRLCPKGDLTTAVFAAVYLGGGLYLSRPNHNRAYVAHTMEQLVSLFGSTSTIKPIPDAPKPQATTTTTTTITTTELPPGALDVHPQSTPAESTPVVPATTPIVPPQSIPTPVVPPASTGDISIVMVYNTPECWHCATRTKKLLYCKTCGVAMYCSVDCIRSDRQFHKTSCQPYMEDRVHPFQEEMTRFVRHELQTSEEHGEIVRANYLSQQLGLWEKADAPSFAVQLPIFDISLFLTGDPNNKSLHQLTVKKLKSHRPVMRHMYRTRDSRKLYDYIYSLMTDPRIRESLKEHKWYMTNESSKQTQFGFRRLVAMKKGAIPAITLKRTTLVPDG